MHRPIRLGLASDHAEFRTPSVAVENPLGPGTGQGGLTFGHSNRRTRHVVVGKLFTDAGAQPPGTNMVQ